MLSLDGWYGESSVFFALDIYTYQLYFVDKGADGSPNCPLT